MKESVAGEKELTEQIKNKKVLKKETLWNRS